ncbi:hypothetical protein [Streptomyces sp. NPDC006997]|uniref:hypothetical protein n=1 Tax=Streptomyces sp. NPDC006997 TaxID=3155356 RepID=UPI0033F50DD3
MEQLTAGQKLDAAFEALGQEKSLSFELDLDTDARTLKALDASSDPEPGDEIPDEVADLFSGVKMSVTVQSKKPLESSEEKDLVGVAVKVGTEEGDLVEYRLVGDDLYIRTDATTLGEAMGFPLPSADDLPPEADGLKKVLAGEWVTLDTKEMEDATAGLGGEEFGEEPSAEPSLDARTQKKLVKALRSTIAREVEFRTSEGDDGAEHVTATAPFRTLVAQLVNEIEPLAAKFPPGMEPPTAKDLKDAPDAEVTADFTLNDGELTEVYVDLAKLAENAEVKKLGLKVSFDDGGTVTAPSGATALDIEDLMGGFAGAMTGAEDF